MYNQDPTTTEESASEVVIKPAKRAPELGEYDEEILKELGFDANEIDGFRASGTLGKPKEPVKGT